MNGWVLLAILIVCAGVVLVMLAYVAVKGWSLFKRTRRVQREMQPLVVSIIDRSQAATAKADALAARSRQLQASVDRLQATLARLSIVAQAAQEASGRCSSLKRYVTK